MLEKQENDNLKIVNMIYEIRGQQVMLDSEISATKTRQKIIDLISFVSINKNNIKLSNIN